MAPIGTVGTTYPATPRTVAAFTWVLQSCQARGYQVTRTKLAKLLYFADLQAVKSGDEPVSGLTWKWLNHGPYDNALMYLENRLVDDGNVERGVEPFYGGKVLSLVRAPAVVELPSEDTALIQDIVNEYGALAAVTLKDLSYQTPPMVDAQSRGRGVLLNLDLVRPRPSLAKASAKMRGVLSRLSDENDDEGFEEDLVRETRESRSSRLRANDILLRP